MPQHIPISSPSLSRLEKKYINRALESTWISSSGYFLEKMQDYISHETTAKFAIPVSNGTVALHLALLSLDIGPGDEVIVPSLAYIAPVNAITYCGAKPVFVDVETSTWSIDSNAIRRSITKKTKAIMVVHNYGMPASMSEIMQVAQENNLVVIEDGAEALFAEYKGQAVGSFGAVGTFSFFGNKIITTGEGGALVTNDPELADRIEMLRGQGMDKQRRYWFPIIGYNYRLTNLAAALFCAQYERKEYILESRERIYAQYDEMLSEVVGVDIQKTLPDRKRSPWLYPILLNKHSKVSRDELIDFLASNQVETRPFFYPAHTLPPYKHLHTNLDLNNTNSLSLRGMNLPTYPELSKKQVQYIVNLIAKAVQDW